MATDPTRNCRETKEHDSKRTIAIRSTRVHGYDLDCDQLSRLAAAVVLGTPIPVATKAEANLVSRLASEVRSIEGAGLMVELPGEFPG